MRTLDRQAVTASKRRLTAEAQRKAGAFRDAAETAGWPSVASAVLLAVNLG